MHQNVKNKKIRMHKAFFLFLFFSSAIFSQQEDFTHLNFKQVDAFAKSYKTKRNFDVRATTLILTEKYTTAIEKLRSIYIWICHNIANDYNLYALNSRKRTKFLKDSIRLQKWNSTFKKKLFKKLLRNKRTICTGYAYLLKEMCEIAGIEAKIVNGFGRVSTQDVTQLIEPNHSWNIVKIEDKWYFCDPTWATGISYPELGKFEFNYNDGYFLTTPEIFIFNHYPVKPEYTLLKNNITFNDYSSLPLLYAAAYQYLENHSKPNKMHHEIKKNESFTFTYQLKKEIDVSSIRFVFIDGYTEKTIQPKIQFKEGKLTLKHTFDKKGFYDVHLYIEKSIIATYTLNVTL